MEESQTTAGTALWRSWRIESVLTGADLLTNSDYWLESP
jgi:hypothetical protein